MAEGTRDGARQVICVHVELCQRVVEPGEAAQDATDQSIREKVQHGEAGQLADSTRDGPGQLVGVEVEHGEGEVEPADARRDRAHELIRVDVERAELGEVADAWWNAPAQPITIRTKGFQPGERAHSGGEGASEVAPVHGQLDHCRVVGVAHHTAVVARPSRNTSGVTTRIAVAPSSALAAPVLPTGRTVELFEGGDFRQWQCTGAVVNARQEHRHDHHQDQRPRHIRIAPPVPSGSASGGHGHVLTH